jgi:hypothetical protein
MDTATKVAQRSLLGAGGLALGLGVLVWAGVGGKQVGGFHVILGMVVVLSLWALCVIAARAGISRAAIALAASSGVIVTSLGIAQKQLVPGDWHWTIRVTHLVVSMGAIWWGRHLVSLMRRREFSALRNQSRSLSRRS